MNFDQLINSCWVSLLFIIIIKFTSEILDSLKFIILRMDKNYFQIIQNLVFLIRILNSQISQLNHLHCIHKFLNKILNIQVYQLCFWKIMHFEQTKDGKNFYKFYNSILKENPQYL
ncbi:unnamed protein product [Paramecium sonneborni]|uniref:Transmembrane protein n=1 Tax=Paramecium sonneborni TaxID=65129 RepID=A0A8S1QBL0_9CILI|nr:unnamed protein product [Paramecium sonneborni]